MSEAELSELSVQGLIALVMELREQNARLAAEIAALIGIDLAGDPRALGRRTQHVTPPNNAE